MTPAPATSAGTAVPPGQSGGSFPPFDTTTFPTQLFWLAITFAVLFIAMWRFAVPRIGGVIGERKSRISGDLSAAEGHRTAAEEASKAYDMALTAARNRAHALAAENHGQVQAEIDRAKAGADADAAKATADAETRIAAVREEARGHVAKVAQDAADAIVTRLLGPQAATQG